MDNLKREPLISIIVPSFNHGNYLRSRLDSIFNQTYNNIEVILLDDASSDNSKDIILEYANHPKVSFIEINENNSGSPFMQWERGVKLAKGNLLWIAESDDSAEKEFLEKMAVTLVSNPNAILIFSDSLNIDEEGKEFGKVSEKHPLLKPIQSQQFLFDQTDNVAAYFISDMLILNVSSVLFNLEKLRQHSDFSYIRQFKNLGDQVCYISLFLKAPFLYLNVPLNFRRKHSDNLTQHNFSKGVIYYERIKVIKHFYPLIKNFRGTRNSLRIFLAVNFIPLLRHIPHKEILNFLLFYRGSGILSYIEYLKLKGLLEIRYIFGKLPYSMSGLVKKELIKLKNEC